MRVLLVEDAPRLREIVARRLREEGYATDATGAGTDAVERALATRYDAIVLDLRLPDLDGSDACAALRSAGCWTPILMLTARDGLRDRVDGLDRGADDYMTKPFEFPELFARLRALVRRGAAVRPAALASGDLVVDPAAHRVTRGGAEVDLTAKEFALGLVVFVVTGRRVVAGCEGSAGGSSQCSRSGLHLFSCCWAGAPRAATVSARSRLGRFLTDGIVGRGHEPGRGAGACGYESGVRR